VGDRVDAVIVGAGAAGSVLTNRLASAGFRVVCIERGDWPDRTTILGATPEAELAWLQRWNPDPKVRRGVGDYDVSGASPVMPVLWNGVGGSMVQWAAMWHPLLPSDFRVKSLDGVADDWPWSWSDLRPFYERAARDMGVSGLGGDPAYPEMAPPPNPPLPIGALGTAAARGIAALGWHWWPGSNAIASRKYRNLEPCQLRGTCITGCPENAKATPGSVFWPDALRDGAKLITRAVVVDVPLDARGRATGVVYVDDRGQHHLQEADLVILAGNAVGTAHLLLTSTSARYPDGLANSSGQVGRNLMQHPYISIQAVLDEPLESWKGPFGESIYSLEFAETDSHRGFVRGAKWMAVPSQGPFAAFSNTDLFASQLDDVIGDAAHARVREEFGHSFVWGIQADDLPRPENQVTLDPDLKDPQGRPSPRIEYTIDENTLSILEFNTQRAVEAAEASGATRVSVSGVWPGGIGHVLGTARMGNDPDSSVVNPLGQSHDVPNLYIADSSLFVTGGSMNPGATIIALAHLVADAIISRTPAPEIQR